MSLHAVPDEAPLVVRTVALDADALAALVTLLPPADQVAWLRRGEGLVGWGVAARTTSQGPDRFAAVDAWWAELVGHAVVRDEVDRPGTGPVCFASFGFADAPGTSVAVVPQVVVGRRGDTAWLTTVAAGTLGRHETAPQPTAAPPAPVDLVVGPGALDDDAWAAAVAEAVARIGDGRLEKVVLARDLIARAGAPIDVRWPLRRLTERYPTCWTFHVEGMFGATPEMLVRRERGLVTSRVLAGTIRRTGDDLRDLALAAALARSSKDLEEHEYAVRSVAEALGPHCTSMNVPEAPFVLHLPNVMHLATDVTGVVPVAESASSLALAAALHPSAAVGGTPTDVAVDTIAEIEGMDRGRYAAPVGWMDARGDGEWGIALRSAELVGEQRDVVRLFAGCGIVGDSDPAAELAEAAAKFLPVRESLDS